MAKTDRTEDVHTLTIGTMLKGLVNMAAIMDKAERHAKTQEIALDNLLQSRFFPDMFNLLQQVQYVCYLSVDFARHFNEAPAPRVGYDEATWPELRKSLDAAAAYLGAIKSAVVSERAHAIVPTFMDDTQGMPAVNYAANVIVPDFHFHMVVAYALLRHNGVALGKSDFLGELDMTTIKSGAA